MNKLAWNYFSIVIKIRVCEERNTTASYHLIRLTLIKIYKYIWFGNNIKLKTSDFKFSII